MTVSAAFADSFTDAVKMALREGLSLMDVLDRQGLLRTRKTIYQDRSDGALELLVRLRALDAGRLLQNHYQRVHGSPAETLIAVKNEAQNIHDELLTTWRET